MTVLPIFRPNCTAVAMASGLVRSVGMTSSSGIRSTGEKKCMPRTLPGRAAWAAMSAIGMVEVLVAKIVVAGVAASVSASTLRLTSRSSNTASMTRSARGKPVKSVPPERSAARRSNSNRVIRFRLSRPARMSVAALSPFPTRASSVSLTRTSTAALLTAVPAMPAPMKPEPITARRSTLRGAAVTPAGRPSSFLRAVVAKKIPISFRETSVAASSPNFRCSTANPRARPPSSPAFTASSAARGAG